MRHVNRKVGDCALLGIVAGANDVPAPDAGLELGREPVQRGVFPVLPGLHLDRAERNVTDSMFVLSRNVTKSEFIFHQNVTESRFGSSENVTKWRNHENQL